MGAIVDIKHVVASDYQEWLGLWQAFQHDGPLPDNPVEIMWQRYIDPDFAMWSLIARTKSDGQAVGLAVYTVHLHTDHAEGSCCLLDLYVSPKARRQGIAQSLIEHVEGHANALNCMSLFWVTGQDNTVAQSLYDRLAQPSQMVTYEMALDYDRK